MFERFTQAARQAVKQAQQEAAHLGDRRIAAEHVLLGVLAEPDSPATCVLRGLGVDSAVVATAMRERGVDDAQALRSIGVDLDAVRSRIESAFGPGALDMPQRRRSWWSRRRSPDPSGPSVRGHIPFSQPAKRALEQSLRQAIALKHNYIAPEHVVLGLIATDHEPASLLLRRLGVDLDVVRDRLRTELRRAA